MIAARKRDSQVDNARPGYARPDERLDEDIHQLLEHPRKAQPVVGREPGKRESVLLMSTTSTA
jgi:hypothetical protein